LIASEPYEYTNSGQSKILLPVHYFQHLRFLKFTEMYWK
jgi:hypothetical protein